jgi:4-amino-4-deoxy-L-arabinose transferase-like glycosyltransferase
MAGSLLLLAVLLEAGMLWVGIDDLDEGYFAQQATRVLHGQVPYRDFDSLYTPGLLYVHAGLFYFLGGPSLVGLRVVSLVGRAAIACLMYGLGRSFARPLWAVVPPLFLLIGLDASPERWEPHPGWLSTAFALLSVWLFPRSSLAAGAAAGLTFLFKQNTGVLILAAAVVFTCLEARFCRTRGVQGGGAPMGAGGWGVWPRALRALRASSPLLVGFAAVTLVWLVPLLFAIDGQATRLAPFIGGVNQAALFSPPEMTDLLPVAAGLLGAWYAWRRCRRPLLAWYVVAGWFLFVTEFPRMDALHLVWSAPLLLVVGAIALDGLPAQLGVVALSTLGLAALPILDWRTDWVGQSRVAISGVPYADGLLVPPRTRDDLVGLVGDLRARTEPGEPIFVYPTEPLVYVLAERPNPTRYDHLYPGAAPPDEVHRVIQQLADVRIVVTSEFWPPFFAPPGDNAPLDADLATNYREVGRYGAYHILERPILAHVFGAEGAARRD